MEIDLGNLVCHNFVVATSSVACIVGLFLLSNKQENNDLQEAELVLFRMSFSYWLVYCVAFGVQKIVLPDWEAIVTSLRITTVLSYFLTFSCVVSLPLHKLAVRHVKE